MSLALSSMKKLFIPFLATAALLAPATGQADQDKSQVVLVLDGSGSMWGRIKGKPKITIAQKVIDNMMQSWDKEIELGLVFYGHRRRGDCKDIEVMLKPQHGNASRVRKLVKGIKPKGKTPISQSILTAAKTLNYTTERATVILVSDGQETCSKVDPCEISKELEKRGADFTAHVIGFDVNKKTAAQLECMARATGGVYRDAKSADKLQDALRDAVQSVKREGYDTAIAVLGRGQSTFQDARLSWGVFARGEPRVELSSQTTSTLELHHEPGQYYVEARIDGHKKRALVAIDPVQVRRHKVVLNIGKLAISSQTDNEKFPVSYQIYNRDGKQLIRSLTGSRVETFLDNKAYTIEASYNGETQSKPVRIRSNLNNAVDFDFRSAQVTVNSLTAGSGRPVKVEWKVEKLNKAGNSEGIVKRGNAQSMVYTLPTGNYQITASYDKLVVTRKVSLKAGQETTENFSFAMGKMRVSASGAQEGPLEWLIYSSKNGKPQKLIASDSGLVGEFNIPAGDYLVIARQNGIEAKKLVRVDSGKLAIVRIPMTGTLKLTARQSSGGKTVYVRWQIFRITPTGELGTEIARGERAQQQFALPAGKYRVVAKHAVAESSATVDIKPGQNVKKDIVLGFGELILQAFNAKGGAPIFVEWSVFQITPEGNIGEQLSRSERTSRAMTLAAGSYHVKVAYKGLKQERKIILDPGKRTVEPFYFNSGVLNLEARKSPTGGQLFADLSIFKLTAGKPEEQVAQIRKANHQFVLPEGKYKVVARHKTEEVSETLTIKAGSTHNQKLTFNYADLDLTAYLQRGGKPSFVEWSVFKLNKQRVGEEVVRATRAQQTFTLPAGSYRVVAQRLANNGSTLQRDVDVVLKAGSLTKKSLYLDIGQVSLQGFAEGQEQGDVRWEIFATKANGKRGKRVKSLKGNLVNVDLPAGKYQVVAVSGDSRRQTTINVEPGKTVKQGDYLIGKLRLSAAAAANKPALFSNWQVFRLKNNKVVAQVAKTDDTILNLSLPTGRYRAIAEYSGIKRTQDFTLPAGKLSQQTLLLGLGELKLTALESKKGAKAYVEWLIYRLDASGKRTEQVVHDAGPERKFELQAGKYEVVAQHKLGERSKTIRVEAGKVVQQSLSLDVGELKFDIVEYKGATPIVSHWRLYQVEKGRRVLLGEDHSPRHQIKLLAGKYELDVMRDNNKVTKKLTVEGGQPTITEVNFQLGQLELNAVQHKSGPSAEVSWELLRTEGASQTKILSATSSGQKLTLPAGRYTLKVSHNTGNMTKQLVIREGKLTRYEYSQKLSDLSVIVVYGPGADSVAADISIKPLDKQGHVTPVPQQDGRFRLTAGRYEITAKHPQRTVTKRIATLAGKESTEIVSLNLGTITMSARQLKGTKPVKASWVLYRVGNKKPKELFRKIDSDISQIVPQGKYRIVITRDDEVRRKNIDVKAGKTVNVRFDFEQGNISLQSQLSDKSDVVVDWKVSRLGKSPRIVKEAHAGKIVLDLDAGNYQVEANYLGRTLKRKISLRPNAKDTQTIIFPIAQLKVTAFDTPKGRQIPARWELFELKGNKVGTRIADQSKSRTLQVKVAPGNYELRARSGSTVLKRRLTLRDKDSKQDQIVFSGVLQVSAFEARNGKPVSIQWSISPVKNGGIGQPIDSSISASRSFTLPAGVYQIKGTHDAREVKAEVNIKAGKNVTRRFDLNIGSLELRAVKRLGGTPVAVQWQIFKILKNDAIGPLVTESIRESRRFVLPNGRYRVRGKHDSLDIEADIRVVPGKHLVREFPISQGQLKLRAINAKTKKGVRVKWLIHQEDAAQTIGKMVTRGIGEDVSFKLPSGKYRVIMKYRDMIGEVSVKVISGKAVKEQFVLHVTK